MAEASGREDGQAGREKSSSKEAKRERQLKSRRPKEAEVVTGLTEEQRLRAMLGYGYGEGADVPAYLVMEYICACCGTEHKAPQLLDAYYLCRSCQNALREPVVLRKRWLGVPAACKLEICFATYGDFFEPLRAFEVTSLIQARVDEIYFRDRLSIRKTSDLSAWFAPLDPIPGRGGDPSPGQPKQLKVRYRMLGIHGTLNLDVSSDNRLSTNFMMLAPKVRYLVIANATYGHPKGLSPQGRMSVDVTEVIQGLVDRVGGSYLTISYMTSVKQMFGDPCPGYPKDLRIRFEIGGREGTVLVDEMRGFLRQKCQIEYAPTICPLVFCSQAFYGISASGRRVRIDQINILLRQINAIEHRLSNGVPPKRSENALLLMKKDLVKEKLDWQNAEVGFVDIRDKVQRICDTSGRHFLLHKDRFNPNAVFGNPQKGKSKLLEIVLESPGHDSERETDSNEMTKSGHPRNFITNKSNRFVVVVHDNKMTGWGHMAESMEFKTDVAAPIIHIARGTFGFLRDPSLTVDVTAEVQAQVQDRKLKITTTQALDKIFSKDPCPGIRKQLKVDYVTRGFQGAVRVRERNDGFVCSVELGYPPVPLEDDGL